MRTNIFNPDFQDFIDALNKAKVAYLLVGGYSVVLHGYSRTTGDMDIWVEKTEVNYKAIIKAFELFGMPLFDMTLTNFLYNKDIDVFTFGRPPVAIDIITEIKGIDFDEAYREAIEYNIDQNTNLMVRVIHINHLIQAKEAVKRPRDIDDINHLKKIKKNN